MSKICKKFKLFDNQLYLQQNSRPYQMGHSESTPNINKAPVIHSRTESAPVLLDQKDAVSLPTLVSLVMCSLLIMLHKKRHKDLQALGRAPDYQLALLVFNYCSQVFFLKVLLILFKFNTNTGWPKVLQHTLQMSSQ